MPHWPCGHHQQQPDRVRVKDTTEVRTLEGFPYLAVVMNLQSRHVVGWPMHGAKRQSLSCNPLLTAVSRGTPKDKVLIRQGSQFASMAMASLLRVNNLEHSMSSGGNCHDNTVTESFFNQSPTDTAPDLQIPQRSQKRRVRLLRDVLQSQTKAYKNWMPSPVEFERQ